VSVGALEYPANTIYHKKVTTESLDAVLFFLEFVPCSNLDAAAACRAARGGGGRARGQRCGARFASGCCW